MHFAATNNNKDTTLPPGSNQQKQQTTTTNNNNSNCNMADPSGSEKKAATAAAAAQSTAEVDTEATRKRTREESPTTDDGPLGNALTNVTKAPKPNAAVDAIFGEDDDDDDSDSGSNGIPNDEASRDSSSNPLIREAETTLEVPGNGGTYTFHLQLLELNQDRVREVSVKLYFDKNDEKPEAKDDSNSNNDEDEGGQEVGYLTGFILPRPIPLLGDAVAEDSPSFYDLAQDVSDELAEVTTLLCNSKGHVTKLRDPSRPTTATDQSFQTQGGFLQIYALEIEGPGHAGTCDLGLHLVSQTLGFLQDEWSLAVMVPCLLGVHGMRWPEYHNRLKIDPSAPEHTTEQTEGLKQAHVAIKRHFSRLGFCQVGRNSEQHHVFYLPASDFGASPASWKSKKDVQSLDIFVAPDPYEPTGVNAVLHTLLQDKDPSDELDVTHIRKLLSEQGASLHGSRALFVAAAKDRVAWMDDLLQVAIDGKAEYKQESLVNESDENGNTPLHVAAMMLHVDVIQYLLNKGASKAIENDKHHTPFDTLQESIESLAMAEECNEYSRGLAKRCETLLKV